MSKDKDWKNLDDCKKEIDLFRNYYDSRSVDITGGEPTIYPHIFELLEYCNKKKVIPTIITNSIVLASKDKAEKFKEAGIKDFLVSVHALGDEYNQITQTKDGAERQRQALENINELEIPWRANVVVMKPNISQLFNIANFLIEHKCRVANFIIFNPFYEWANMENIEFQARHSEITKPLINAIDILENNNIEANVRYFPLCLLPDHEKNIYGFSQLSYDIHEWDFFSWYRLDKNKIKELSYSGIMDGLNFTINQEEIAKFKHVLNLRSGLYMKSFICLKCSISSICEGLSVQYAKQFGFSELKPFKNGLINDPKYFIKNQMKVGY